MMVLKSILLVVLITLAIAMHVTSAFVAIVRNTDTATNQNKNDNHNNGRIRIEERRRRITTPLLSSTTMTMTMTTTQLFLAAARRSTGNKKTNSNKKKKKGKSTVTAFDTSSTSSRRKNTNKKSRNNNTAAASGESKATTPMITTASVTKNQKKKQYAAPPWQTISTKDMNKNAEVEKERRRIAQETGQHMTPYEVDDTKRSYTRSLSFLSSADQLLLSWKNSFRSSSSGSSSSSSGSGGGSGKIDPNKHEIIFQGAYLQKQLPPRMGVPEIAFLGRSNVGKSSLLNRLVSNACDVARVGKTPGATASVNLYAIFDKAKNKKSQQEQLSPKPRRRRPRQQQTTTASSGTTTTNNNKKNNNNSKPLLGLVDLPGFGYAKLDKGTKQSVQDTAEQYLAKRKELALGILLVDSRRTPTMDDKAVLAALYDMGLPLMVVATKVDKYSTQPQIDTALLTINQELGLPPGQPLCVSCVTGQGIKDLWNIIMEACESHVEELRTDIEHGGSSSSTNNQQQQQKSMEYYSGDNNDGDDYDDEIAYSQGYDWIQGSVMYEEDYDEQYFDDNDDRKNNSKDNDYYKVEDDNDDMSGTSTNTANDNAPKKESLKDLRKKAKEMEKRGEFY